MIGHHLTDLTFDQIAAPLMDHLTKGTAADVDRCIPMIAEAAGMKAPAPGIDERYRYDGIVADLDAWLVRTDADDLAKTRDLLPIDRSETCDPELFEALLDGGINPYAMLLVARAIGVPTTMELPYAQAGGRYGQMSMLKDEGGHWEIMVKLQADVHWTGSRLLVRSGMIPTTLLQAMIGRPVSRVINHPLIGETDVVSDVADDVGGFVDLEVEGRPRRSWLDMRAGMDAEKGL